MNVVSKPVAAFLCAMLPTAAAAQDDSTWSLIQHTILNNNCVSCHRAGQSFATQSDLILTEDTAYDQLLDVLPKNTAARADGLKRVSSIGGFPGLQQSFLWEKINAPEQLHFYDDHPNYGAIMPLGLPPLTNGELALVKTWIMAGAPQTGIVANPSLLEDTTRYEPPDFVPLSPPERGIQLHLGPFDVWSSEVHDREFLYYQPFATESDLLVTRFDVSYREGSHHFILYNYPHGSQTPQPNTFRDVRTQNGTVLPALFEIGRLFPFQMFVGTQTPFTTYHLPPGVALRLPRNAGFDFNVHSVNRSGETRQGEVYVNLHTADPAQIRYVAETDYFGDTNFTLPANQVTTLTNTFTFPEQRHLIQMWSHSHEHTLEFRIERVGGEHDGELIYWTNDWEHPPLLTFDPPLTFEAGEQVRLSTTYDNWTDHPIGFGFLSSDEMQFMFYTYFTGDYSPPELEGDLNLDGVVNRLDLAQFVRYFGRTSGSTWTEGDFNDDGKTTLADLRILQANFDRRRGANSPVPEPQSWLIALCGAALALTGSARRAVFRPRRGRDESRGQRLAP
jgi:hypothetical protein